jgi:hypothetical protein
MAGHDTGLILIFRPLGRHPLRVIELHCCSMGRPRPVEFNEGEITRARKYWRVMHRANPIYGFAVGLIHAGPLLATDQVCGYAAHPVSDRVLRNVDSCG